MLRHMVFFKSKFPSDAPLIELKERLQSMVGQVKDIISLEIGLDIVHSERSYDAALTITVENEEALGRYAADPYHQEIMLWIKEQEFETKVVDYEF